MKQCSFHLQGWLLTCSHETQKLEKGNGIAGSQAGGCSALLRLLLCQQSTLWQAPHLSCQLSPFFHKNPCVRNGLRDPVPIDIFLRVGEKCEKSVEKREKRERKVHEKSLLPEIWSGLKQRLPDGF